MRFEQLSKEFVKTYFAFRPLEAVALGRHEDDGQFVVPDQAALDKEVQRLKSFDSALAEIPTDALSPVYREDLALLRAAISGQRWMFETQQSVHLNPMSYAGALDLSVYLKRDFKPLANRAESMTAILRNAPALFAAARANLAPVLPRPFVETAIEVAQREHPTAANLIPDARRNLESIRQFLVDDRIVSLPSKVRPLVEETLPPFRSTSFASMDTPGPFEKKATEAYYYVTPVEPTWSPLGKLMILKLRADWQTQAGPAYTLERFHDEFLRHGAPPIPLLRKVLLKDPQTWPHLL